MTAPEPAEDTVLISLDELARLHTACKLALDRYEPETQFIHLQEEMAELGLALSRHWRKRSTHDDILEEIVDVFQCCIQMGVHHYGPEKFNEMLKRKNDKFLSKFVERDGLFVRLRKWWSAFAAPYGWDF